MERTEEIINARFVKALQVLVAVIGSVLRIRSAQGLKA